MIAIEEIPVENINDFWDIHLKYLVDDGIIDDPEDVEYFSGDEYRDIIKNHMLREKEDSVRFWKSIGFIENGKDEYDMPIFVKK